MSNLPVKQSPGAMVSQGTKDDFEILSAFESETAAVLIRISPRHERIILHVLVAMIVIALGLCAVVKLDRVVTGNGRILSIGGPLYVSPLNPGVVMDIRVKPGEIVEKGQILATMDPTLTNADVATNEARLESDEASIARFTAEYNDQPFVPSGENPYNEVQRSIWLQRQTEYKANISSFNAQIAASSHLVEQYQHDEAQYRKRYDLAKRRQQMVAPLIAKGYVSELQLNTAQDAAEELSRELSDSQNQIAQQLSTTAASREQKAAFEQKWHSDVGNQLVSLRNDLDSTKESLEKAKKNVELNTLIAPARSVVLKIANVSKGSIAGMGTVSSSDPTNPQLFTLAPLDTPVEAEIDVQSGDIGFIRVGDPVSIKLDAYSYVQHGLVKGKIKSISEGSFTTDQNNLAVAPYFKVRVEITEVSLKNVPEDFRLIPGMTIVGDALLGSRTIMSYIVEGALRTGSEAMREAK
jgi:HlyD family secretion protein